VLVYSVLGELQLLRRDPQGARDLLTPLLDRQDLDAVPAELGARLRCVLAFAEHAGGKLERARELSEQGVTLALTLKGSARSTLLRCRSVAGAVLADLNRDADAMQMLRTALSEAEGLDEGDSESALQLAQIEHAYALGSYYGGNVDDSILHNERALAIYARRGRSDSSEALSTLGNLAMARLNGGRVLDADASFADVIARTQEHVGASAGLSQRLINAASAKLVLEQPDAALPLLDRAAAIQRDLKIAEGAPLAQAALERSKAALLRGELDAADTALAQAGQRIAASYPPSHYYHGLVPEQRGRLWHARGDTARAQTELAIAAAQFRAGGRAALRPFVRVLALQSEYAMAAGDTATLRSASDEAATAAQALPISDWMRAWAEALQGRNRQLAGDDAGAEQIRAAEPRLAAALGAEHRLTRNVQAWASRRAH
jgi:tetratricopeptide (TPR) repeat protein